MMEWTDRHCRYFLRLLSPKSRLYTEMLTAEAVRHGDAARLLAFHEAERPLALQLGGSDPGTMADAARLGADAGYDEVNINVGCPSDRVQNGRFGACLMARPDVVARCYRAMRAASGVPVTVKTRIGIDDKDDDEFLRDFVLKLVDAGCTTFIVHARIAMLQGLNPKENRSIPPLNYERVYRLKEDYPELTIVLNGEISSCAEALEHLERVDGVMIGRQAYHDPYFLTELEKALHPGNDWQPPGRSDVVESMIPYIEQQMAAGTRLAQITRHLLGLFAGQPGARAWRRHLSEHAHAPGAGVDVLRDALAKVPLAA